MAELIRGTLNPESHSENLFFMDKYGKPFYVVLSMTAGPARADKIASTLTAMTTAEAAVDAYYTAVGQDNTAALAAGAAAIAAAKAQTT
jgi:hypothetical protein